MLSSGFVLPGSMPAEEGSQPISIKSRRRKPNRFQRDTRRKTHRPRSRPHPAPSVLRTVVVAFLWVTLGLTSLASTVTALWIGTALARHAAQASTSTAPSVLWVWGLGLFMTLGLPFILAAWQGAGDARRISVNMTWLPMAWNTIGLLLASQLIPDLMGSALRANATWIVADRLGDTHAATRVLSALGHEVADTLAPPAATELSELDYPKPLDDSSEADMSMAISVPMEDGGTAIFIDAMLEGHDGQLVALPYLFDTGASFTTISTDTAHKLGIEIPDDAPVLTFNTASGPRKSRMVYLPAIRVGRVRIPSLLVSVCDGCVNKRHAGLLGQNVMRRFFVQMDFLAGRTLLVPRVVDERINRAYDIEPVVEMNLDGAPEVWLGRIRWVIAVENKGSVPLYDVTPVVRFTNGPSLQGETIDVIQPGEVGRSLVEGKASNGRRGSKGQYQLVLAEAYW